MNVLYTLGIRLFELLLHLIAPFYSKAQKAIDGRKKIDHDLSAIDTNKKSIWMHCASLGEYEMGKPFLNKLKLEYPEYNYVVSFFSPSGYEPIKTKSKDEIVVYLPLDLPQQQYAFISKVNPQLVIFVKYEFWYNLIQILSQKDIPQIVISALFSENKIYFQWYGNWFRKKLKLINQFFVQNKASLNILEQFDFQNVTLSGDTRFERVKENKIAVPHFPRIEEFKGHSPLIIGGSTWENGEKLFLKYIENHRETHVKLIIAPHEIGREKIGKLKHSFEKDWGENKVILWSELEKEENLSTFQLLLVDTIGVLKYLYAYSDIAYVGGGFKKGGLHNILEPSVFGNALLIGPEFSQFPEAKEMLENQSLISIDTYTSFEQELNSLLNDPKRLKNFQKASKEYIYSKPIATEIIFNEVVRRNWLA